MIVLSSMKAMRKQRINLFASLVLSLWSKFKDQPSCEVDCC